MKQTVSLNDAVSTDIPGYDFGRASAARSPISLDELRQLEHTVGWSDEDAHVLRRYGHIFKEHAEQMVDSWRAVIGAQPHLLQAFIGPDGRCDEAYAAKVKPRFVQWVLDACFRPHDQAWLDYQLEIGLRHTPDKKNRTDDAHTPPVVPLRYLIAFIPVVTRGARPFFVNDGLAGEELRKLEDAWTKTVHLHVTLWTRPYAAAHLW